MVGMIAFVDLVGVEVWILSHGVVGDARLGGYLGVSLRDIYHGCV